VSSVEGKSGTRTDRRGVSTRSSTLSLRPSLSYRHLFHAGNFADVFKHALLTRLLIALNGKETPYCYLDTHAGTGRYDLRHAWAQKAREYENGIARLWTRRDIPQGLEPYLSAVRAENADGDLRFYPGSPLLARRIARGGDRVVLSELNKTDFEELSALFARERHTAVHLLDGYQALKAFLPPQERRGLVLLDSSFDRAREFSRIAKALKQAHTRWPTGIYAIWYPLMEAPAMRGFARDMTATGVRKILRLEFDIASVRPGTISGCGLLVVNPPWRFDAEARQLLDWLWRALSPSGSGGMRVDWLVPE
jgi:23S rRNA (adenine2030-N6)-methyltransferase